MKIRRGSVRSEIMSQAQLTALGNQLNFFKEREREKKNVCVCERERERDREKERQKDTKTMRGEKE